MVIMVVTVAVVVMPMVMVMPMVVVMVVVVVAVITMAVLAIGRSDRAVHRHMGRMGNRRVHGARHLVEGRRRVAHAAEDRDRAERAHRQCERETGAQAAGYPSGHLRA